MEISNGLLSSQRPPGHRFHPYAENNINQNLSQPQKGGWEDSEAVAPLETLCLTDLKNLKNSILQNISIMGAPSSESAHPRNKEFSWPLGHPVAIEDIPLPLGNPPSGQVHMDPPFYTKILVEIDQGHEEKPEIPFEEARQYSNLGLPFVKLEPLPEFPSEGESSLSEANLPSSDLMDPLSDIKIPETGAILEAQPNLMEVKPDPKDLHDVWDELFGLKTKKEVPQLKESTASSTGSAKLPLLLSPDMNLTKKEELEPTKAMDFLKSDLAILLKKCEESPLQLQPAESLHQEEPQTPLLAAELPSPFMQNLLSATKATGKKQKHCQKCERHGILRPFGLCRRQKGQACPFFNCECDDCKEVDGNRACSRRFHQRKKNRESLLQNLLLLPDQPEFGAVQHSA